MPNTTIKEGIKLLEIVKVALNGPAVSYKVTFEKSKLGDDAVAIGAAVNVIKQISES